MPSSVREIDRTDRQSLFDRWYGFLLARVPLRRLADRHYLRMRTFGEFDAEIERSGLLCLEEWLSAEQRLLAGVIGAGVLAEAVAVPTVAVLWGPAPALAVGLLLAAAVALVVEL